MRMREHEGCSWWSPWGDAGRGEGEGDRPDLEGLVLSEHDEDGLRVGPSHSQDGLAVSHPAYGIGFTEGALRARAGTRHDVQSRKWTTRLPHKQH